MNEIQFLTAIIYDDSSEHVRIDRFGVQYLQPDEWFLFKIDQWLVVGISVACCLAVKCGNGKHRKDAHGKDDVFED